MVVQDGLILQGKDGVIVSNAVKTPDPSLSERSAHDGTCIQSGIAHHVVLHGLSDSFLKFLAQYPMEFPRILACQERNLEIFTHDELRSGYGGLVAAVDDMPAGRERLLFPFGSLHPDVIACDVDN